MPVNLENSAVVTGLEKVSFRSSPKEGQCWRMPNYHTIALISHVSDVMLKILQARLRQYVNWELPDVQAGFRKGRETRNQYANIRWITEKSREFQENICFWTVWITTNCRKFLKRWEYQTTSPASCETCMQFKKQQLESNTEQRTGSKLVPQGYILSPYLFNFICRAHMCMLNCFSHVWFCDLMDCSLPGSSVQGIFPPERWDPGLHIAGRFFSSELPRKQSTSCRMPGWINHKLDSRLPGGIPVTSGMQMTPPLWQKAKRS